MSDQDCCCCTAKVGQAAPQFDMPAVVDGRLDARARLKDLKGKWVVLYFYPLDFTFVCPTEITGLDNRINEFQELNAVVIGCSTDSVHSHNAWMQKSPKEGGIGKLVHPLASDLTGKVCRDYGVYLDDQGIALRGLFIIDPDGVLQYGVVHALNVGRSVDETLRVLQALQSGGLCPINWQPGQSTLKV
ncbi:MAG: Alkyl hydroperoxide reductase C [Phycisphaerae bacterium]|nr:Alkyl hydroperoxide reductase C [Phycisphaerae bacterium]